MSWRSKSKWMSSSSARAANSAGAGRADPSGARGSDVPGDAAPGDDVPGDVVPGDAVPGRVVTSVSGVTGDSVAAAPPERGGAGAAARGGAETSTVTVRFAHAATISTVSRPYRRRHARTFWLRGRRNSIVPRPNTGEVRRAAISRFIVLRSDAGCRACAATFTAW